MNTYEILGQVAVSNVSQLLIGQLGNLVGAVCDGGQCIRLFTAQENTTTDEWMGEDLDEDEDEDEQEQ
jgi:hypothetical protein